ncbi:hypothetical protein [Rhodopseudomonas palustris]|uniref:Lipoprotein n=1 Tax=Rhodopseudomonas palustris (strain BisB18) TaxID=316056 RepID=Q217H3_RHOPB
MIIGDRNARRFRHLTVVAQVLASGCSNETAPELPPESNERATEAGPQRWLAQSDGVTPEHWLLEHQRRANAAAPSVAQIRDSLANAARNFADSPRMIANRVVQLEAMLAQQGIAENALELLGDLSFAAPAGRRAEGFGARCQQYYLLRIRSPSKQQALSALRASNHRD